MAEVLAGFAAISSVVQVIDFTAKVANLAFGLIRGSYDALPLNAETRALVREYGSIGDTTLASISQEARADPDVRRLLALATICSQKSGEMMEMLTNLSLDPNLRGAKRFGQIMRKTLETQIKRKKIEEKSRQLADWNSQLSTAMILLLRTGQHEQRALSQRLLGVVETSHQSSVAVVLQARDAIFHSLRDIRADQLQTTTKLDDIGLTMKADQSQTTAKLDDIRLDMEADQSQTTAKLDDIRLNMEADQSQTTAKLDDIRLNMEADQQQTTAQLSDIGLYAKTAHISKLERQIIQSLSYPELGHRRDTIPPAYQKTFEWIVGDDRMEFVQWLQHDSGIFWVSGKPGSGKSTLMRFLMISQATRRFLTQWADRSGSQLLTAEFYFWYTGSTLQKSIEGLLRSLLIQILNNCQRGVEVAFPDRWATAKELGRVSGHWSYNELLQGLDNLATACERMRLVQQNGKPSRFCFFIDGLDEFQGNHWDLIQLLRKLTRGPQIKICASSRAWNVFRTAFEQNYPFLRLEDLTRSDIAEYVRGILSKTTSELDESQRPVSQDVLDVLAQLEGTIVSKAQGVFLWVHLVVKSLQEGLWEGDGAATLRERVELFPRDLEAYFQQILDRISDVYRLRAAMTLKLSHAYVAERSSAWALFDFVDFWLIRDHASSMTLPGFGLEIPTSLCDDDRLQVMRTETERFLNSCTKGLLCVTKVSGPLKRVDFLHRTVCDFLSSDSMQDWMTRHTPKGFGNLDTFRQFALARCKVVLVDLPEISTYRIHDSLNFEFNRSHSGSRLADEVWSTASMADTAMYSQYANLIQVYRDRFNGLRIENNRALAAASAVHCEEIVMGEPDLKADNGGESHMILAAALGVSRMNPFGVGRCSHRLVSFLLSAGFFPCTPVWLEFCRQWLYYDETTRNRQDSRVCTVEEQEHLYFLAWTATAMLCGGVPVSRMVHDTKPQAISGPELPTAASLRCVLSNYIDSIQLEELLAEVQVDDVVTSPNCNCSSYIHQINHVEDIPWTRETPSDSLLSCRNSALILERYRMNPGLRGG